VIAGDGPLWFGPRLAPAVRPRAWDRGFASRNSLPVGPGSSTLQSAPTVSGTACGVRAWGRHPPSLARRRKRYRACRPELSTWVRGRHHPNAHPMCPSQYVTTYCDEFHGRGHSSSNHYCVRGMVRRRVQGIPAPLVIDKIRCLKYFSGIFIALSEKIVGTHFFPADTNPERSMKIGMSQRWQLAASVEPSSQQAFLIFPIIPTSVIFLAPFVIIQQLYFTISFGKLWSILCSPNWPLGGWFSFPT